MVTKPWARMTQLTTLALGLGLAATVAWGGEQPSVVGASRRGVR